MRVTRIVLGMIGAIVLTGCLVSETPVLTSTNGNATPLKSGSYVVCEIDAGGGENDCESNQITVDETGLYFFTANEERVIEVRFRRVGRGGYATQVQDGEDGYLYYYAYGASPSFFMKMMFCEHLPQKLRDRLIKRGDLSIENDDNNVCKVNTLRGLKAAAKAYRQGSAIGDEEAVLIIKPAVE